MLNSGTTVDIVVDFISLEDTNNATLKVSAIILGHEIQLLSEDACKNMGIQCPIKANQAYSGQTSVPIESSYPTVSFNRNFEIRNQLFKLFCSSFVQVKLTVKGQLIDANGVDLACITIPAQISK